MTRWVGDVVAVCVGCEVVLARAGGVFTISPVTFVGYAATFDCMLHRHSANDVSNTQTCM